MSNPTPVSSKTRCPLYEAKPTTTDPITDKTGRIYTVDCYREGYLDCYFVLTPFGRRIAKTNIILEDSDEAFIADVEVCTDVQLTWREILCRYPRNFRKRGIASQLLIDGWSRKRAFGR